MRIRQRKFLIGVLLNDATRAKQSIVVERLYREPWQHLDKRQKLHCPLLIVSP